MKLVRADELTAQDLEALRPLLYRVLDGMGEQDADRWRRFWGRVVRAPVGTLVELETTRKRYGPFHRLHMSMEQALFDMQEIFPDFNLLRDWLKIGAGHVQWVTGPGGQMWPLPKSIAYDKLDDDGMREFHGRVIDFLRTPDAARMLWPALKPAMAAHAVEHFIKGYEQPAFQ